MATTVARARARLPSASRVGRPVAALATSVPTVQPTTALPIAVSATPGKAAATRPGSHGRPTAHAIHAASCAQATMANARPAKGAASHEVRGTGNAAQRSEEHTSELQSRLHLVCRLLLEKKKNSEKQNYTYSFGVST